MAIDEKSRVSSPVLKGREFGQYLSPLDSIVDSPEVLNVFPLDDDPEFLARKALEKDLSNVHKFRFDPINGCNLSCLFCSTNLKTKNRQISLTLTEKIVRKVAASCKRMTIGCAYEPLLAKNIEDYGEIFKKVIASDFQHEPVANMQTNGNLLHRRKLDAFADFLHWVHLSVHSHQKDTYETIMRNGDYGQLVRNLKMFKTSYPHLRLHLEMVVNHFNYKQVTDFIGWGFEQIQADTINLRQIVQKMDSHPNSNLAIAAGKEDKLALEDEQWSDVIKTVFKSYNAYLSSVTGYGSHVTSVLELSKTDYKKMA